MAMTYVTLKFPPYYENLQVFPTIQAWTQSPDLT